MTLVALITMSTGALAQDVDCNDNDPNAGKTMDVAKSRAPRRAAANFGDLLTDFNCSSGYQYGICIDGNSIYTTSWSTGIDDGYVFHEYDLDGNLIDAFNISDVTLGVRDIAYDGTYFYGATCSSTVYQLDLANRTLVGTLTIPTTVRAIAYDSKRDGFWAIGNWASTMALYDRSGNKIHDDISCSSISGIAYYEDTDGEEHVLMFSNSDTNVYDYNITNNRLDGAVFDASSIGSGSAGGCTFGVYKGKGCFFADLQGSPNHIGIYQLPNAIIPPEITLNDDATEASFEMPANDVTVTYELIRDMGIGVAVKVNGEATNGETSARINVNLGNDGKYTLDAPLTYELKDMLENETTIDAANYTFTKMQRLNGDTWEDLDAEAEMIPGTYCVSFTAVEGTLYDGICYSGEFELYDFATAVAMDKKAAEEVMQYIRNIGVVDLTEECKALIDRARAAYDALTDDQKKLVTIYGVLVEAEEEYARLSIATGIDSVKADGEDSEWFGLDGQRLNGKPTKKGIYVKDGKKVVNK